MSLIHILLILFLLYGIADPIKTGYDKTVWPRMKN
jgi:hypothetical protein